MDELCAARQVYSEVIAAAIIIFKQKDLPVWGTPHHIHFCPGRDPFSSSEFMYA